VANACRPVPTTKTARHNNSKLLRRIDRFAFGVSRSIVTANQAMFPIGFVAEAIPDRE
jgi:hypothetical protein